MSAHNLFYWMSQHLSMRVCQFFFDHSRSFRVWWGIDGPPIPRTPYARAELRVQTFYGEQDLVFARKLAHKVGIHPAIIADSLGGDPVTEEWTAYHEFRKRTDPPPYGQGLEDDTCPCGCQCPCQDESATFRKRVEEAQAALADGSDEALLAYLKRPEPVNYEGPDESVECAYEPCTRRLRLSALGGPQWCSIAHREKTEEAELKHDRPFGPDENDAHRLGGHRGYMS